MSADIRSELKKATEVLSQKKYAWRADTWETPKAPSAQDPSRAPIELVEKSRRREPLHSQGGGNTQIAREYTREKKQELLGRSLPDVQKATNRLLVNPGNLGPSVLGEC